MEVAKGKHHHHHHKQQVTAISIEQQPNVKRVNAAAVKRQQTLMHTNDAVPYGLCSRILIVLSYILTIITFPVSVFACIKIVQQYERAVIFRLGKLKGAKGPGLFFVIPCIDKYRKVDLRVVTFSIPPQKILSKDSVTVEVDAVFYFRISNATISIVNAENAVGSTKLMAQTTLRNVLGTKTLSEMLSERERISHQIQKELDDATEHWGVNVERVEVRDIRPLREIQRAMASEVEASRKTKAKDNSAESVQKASYALREADQRISETSTALQLSYSTISSEHTTNNFPFLADIMSSLTEYSSQTSSSQMANYSFGNSTLAEVKRSLQVCMAEISELKKVVKEFAEYRNEMSKLLEEKNRLIFNLNSEINVSNKFSEISIEKHLDTISDSKTKDGQKEKLGLDVQIPSSLQQTSSGYIVRRYGFNNKSNDKDENMYNASVVTSRCHQLNMEKHQQQLSNVRKLFEDRINSYLATENRNKPFINISESNV